VVSRAVMIKSYKALQLVNIVETIYKTATTNKVNCSIVLSALSFVIRRKEYLKLAHIGVNEIGYLYEAPACNTSFDKNILQSNIFRKNINDL
jgi:hypothetical protein